MVQYPQAYCVCKRKASVYHRMSNEYKAIISYTRFDDEHNRGYLTELCLQLSKEVRAYSGEPFSIFQDVKDIGWGEPFEQKITAAIAEATFFIPILTPSFFKSAHCRKELQWFLAREQELQRNDLILPVYYIECDELEKREASDDDDLIQVVASHQWLDWRELRFEQFDSPTVRKMLAKMARQIRYALRRKPETPQHSPPSPPIHGRESGISPLRAGGTGVALVPSESDTKRPTLEVPPPVRSRINPLFPVTVDEWRDDVAQRDTVFGNPAGYWCYVRPGTYAIGGWEPNDAVETIALPGFWIGKYPVTVQQYHQFMHAGGYTNERLWTPNGWKWRTGYDEGKVRTQPWGWDDAQYNSNNQPVIGVTWYEAAAFAAWLNTELASSLPSDHRIRLPTEAEWEAAAAYDGHGKRRTYPWGEQEPSSAHVYNENLGGNKAAAAPVGGRPAGAAACGAHDMVGTVWEWTASEWNAYPAGSGTVVKDYIIGSDRVSLRGASWWNSSNDLLCAARYWYYPYYGYVGFRLVLSP